MSARTLTLDDIERLACFDALERLNGSRSQVSRELKIGRTTLYRKLERWPAPERDDRRARAFKMLRGEETAMSETIKAIHAENNRVRKAIPYWESLATTPGTARDLLEAAILEGERSIEAGDVVRMTAALKELRTIENCKAARGTE